MALDPTAEPIVEQPGSGTVRGDLNFRQLLFLEINRCGQLLATMPRSGMEGQPGISVESIVFAFASSVRLLETLLKPYMDDIYRKEVEEWKKSMKELEESEDGLHRRNTSDIAEEMMQTQYQVSYERLESLVSLAHRMGLLFEGQGEDVV